MAIPGQRTSLAIILLLATLMIGAIVYSQLGHQASDIASQNNDTQAQSFISNTLSTGWSALQMLVIGAIVLAAVFILGLLGYLGGGGGGAI